MQVIGNGRRVIFFSPGVGSRFETQDPKSILMRFK